MPEVSVTAKVVVKSLAPLPASNPLPDLRQKQQDVMLFSLTTNYMAIVLLVY